MKETVKKSMRSTIMTGALLMVAAVSHAGVVFQTNFDSLKTWNPAAFDACWQNVQVEGGASSCSQQPWTGSWSAATSVWNDYRVLGPQCSSTWAPHIGSAADILSSTGKTVTPYGGAGKAYVHIYEPCMSASGGWGSDGLVGVYFGKTNGYTELYAQMKVQFDPKWAWTNGAQMKLMHFTHFDETYNSGVLQAFHFFYPDNMPTVDPGIYFNNAYSPVPGFYFNSYNKNNTISGGTIGYPSTSINMFDGKWHTLQFHVKLNSAAGVADGIAEVWVDSETTAPPALRHTNFPYTGSSSPSASTFGFNRVLIGGNTSNTWLGSSPSCASSKSCPTQYYMLDDLVVSTTPIPLNYSTGGSSAPSAPGNLRGTGTQ